MNTKTTTQTRERMAGQNPRKLLEKIEREIRTMEKIRKEWNRFAATYNLIGARLDALKEGKGVPETLVDYVAKKSIEAARVEAEEAAQSAVFRVAEGKILKLERELRKMRKTLWIAVGAGFSIAVILSVLLEKLI